MVYVVISYRGRERRVNHVIGLNSIDARKNVRRNINKKSGFVIRVVQPIPAPCPDFRRKKK